MMFYPIAKRPTGVTCGIQLQVAGMLSKVTNNSIKKSSYIKCLCNEVYWFIDEKHSYCQKICAYRLSNTDKPLCVKRKKKHNIWRFLILSFNHLAV